ncbi:hypothetical protein QCA50_012362 [Cerrena zonata]|uniref:Ubiquitin-like protease family profile domain-containing protein n=1 Tax=Cerrena zonata TaxID=2478898 RepID=A0AAW0G5X6_9APHY
MASQTSSPLDIDSDENIPFIQDNWIRKNKVYPVENTPSYIATAHNEVFEIPSSLKVPIPDSNTTIATFLECRIPSLSSNFIQPKLASWFSDDHPNTPLRDLFNSDRHLPPRETIKGLLKISGQQWFDGRRSIRDPRYNKGAERFPLSALSVWQMLTDTRHTFDSWKVAQHWVLNMGLQTQSAVTVGLSREVVSLFSQLGWSVPVRPGHVSMEATEFARLLCSGPETERRGWLSDAIIDLMVMVLNERLGSTSVRGTLIGDVRVIDGLMRTSAVKDFDVRKRNKDLYNISDAVHKGTVSSLYFPVCAGACHWVIMHVNFTDSSVQIGDSHPSLGFQLKKELAALQQWSQKVLGRRLVVLKSPLPIGTQKDSMSCGLHAINSIAHHVFGDPLLEATGVAEDRLRWFSLLVTRFGLPPQRRIVINDLLNPTQSESISITTHYSPTGPSSPIDPGSPSTPTSTPSTLPSQATTDLQTEIDDSDVPPQADTVDYKISINPKGTELNTSPLSSFKRLFQQPKLPSKSIGKRKAPQSQQEEVLPKRQKTTEEPKVVGTSKSATYARDTRVQIKAGTFAVVRTKLREWQKEIKQFDAKAEFKVDDPVNVRCGRCGNWYNMSDPYITRPHRRHLNGNCKGNGSKSLVGMLKDGTWKGKATASKEVESKEPCPGLSERQNPLIPLYCDRTGAVGGGARSVTKIAEEMYGEETIFKLLSDQQKIRVRERQRIEHRWRNVQREH